MLLLTLNLIPAWCFLSLDQFSVFALWCTSQWSWKLTIVTAFLNANYKPDVSLISWCCQFRALSDQFHRTPELHEFVREEVVNQVGLSLMIIKIGFFYFVELCVIVFHWNHRALHTNLMFNVSCLAISCTINLSLIQIYMRGMFPWHMVTIWRRCPSIFLFLLDLIIPSFWFLLTLFLHHVDAYRSGEWDDHVTLQAAADSVCSSYVDFVFSCLWYILHFPPLNFG